jgi:hypothetical protein
MSAAPRPLALTLLLAACGPGSAGTDGSSTDATATDAATTAATTDTPTTGEPYIPAVCDAPGGDIDPFPDPATCQDYRGDQGQGDLEIGIINHLAQPVFVRGDSRGFAGRVRLMGEVAGRAVHAPYFCDDDPPRCSDVIDGVFDGCELVDTLPPTLRIEPGARHQLLWKPYLAFPVELSAACPPAPGYSPGCTTSLPPVPGAYTLWITYAQSCEGECSCEPQPDGGCTLTTGDIILSDPIFVQAAYDGVCAVIDLVIE